jgi:hypothetical protein
VLADRIEHRQPASLHRPVVDGDQLAQRVDVHQRRGLSSMPVAMNGS